MTTTQTVALLAEMASDTTELDIAIGSQNHTISQESKNNKTVHFILPDVEEASTDPEKDQGFSVPKEVRFHVCNYIMEQLSNVSL